MTRQVKQFFQLKKVEILPGTCQVLLTAFILSGSILPVEAIALNPSSLETAANPAIAATTGLDLSQQGAAFYAAGQYQEAIAAWEQAAAAFAAEGDTLNQAMALSNLSLSYQQLGSWELAQNAIAQSLNLLGGDRNQTTNKDLLKILAQTLDIQGKLQLSTGQAEAALETWQQAEAIYDRAKDSSGRLGSQINQAQAMQALGLYRRARSTLEQVAQTLQNEPDSMLKATGLRSLGNALRVIGELEDAQAILEQSLTVASNIESPQAEAEALLSLGNIARSLQESATAMNYYQQAAQTASAIATRIQAQLNQLSLFIETGDTTSAQTLAPQIESALTSLPPSRTRIYAQINLATSLLKLNRPNLDPQMTANTARLLATAVQDAKTLGDKRAESYALGDLGQVYEQSTQAAAAQELTEQALLLAQEIDALDIAYRWQWQLGRLLNQQGDRENAIAAYSQAVSNLQSLRSDLVAINPDVQFSFRESVEPVYRELVSLLLKADTEKPSPENLKQARDVIESLQLAELDNFFREACLDAKEVQIDQVDQRAAVIYPVILPGRLEIIVSLPGEDLRHYTTSVTQADLESTLAEMKEAITIPRYRLSIQRFWSPSQRLYNWLMAPILADIGKENIKTLVFVLDGSLRNLPMAALYDGEKYLFENYDIALTPGLQLLQSQPLQRETLTALTGGLTEARSGFSALPNVKFELQQINDEVPGAQLLLNEQFTSNGVQNAVKSFPYPIVHLATHGQFSSKAEDTFILTWDGTINVNELGNLLRSREEGRTRPIELLVLSACQTVAGDQRAALGLAGVAMRAGARSTLASLWAVSDEATAALMSQFYRELTDPSVTKASALRRAQLDLLQDPTFRHPYYWAPFVLLGNWL